MALPYINATFLNLKQDDGLCRAVAYLIRAIITKQRGGTTFDFSALAHDLVYGEL